MTDGKSKPLIEKAADEARRSAEVLAGEESRRAAASAKTSRLRAQRLAKEAAEREPAPKHRTQTLKAMPAGVKLRKAK